CVETHDLIGTHARDVDPESLYAALRVRRGLGERGYIGLFATAVSRFETGLDSRWRSTSGAYEVDGDVAASLILGGPPRMQRDGVVIASGDASPQARIHAAK